MKTRKGDLNRQIAADNKLLKEIKARITRLYNWSKEEAARPQAEQPTMSQLWAAQQEMSGEPRSRYGRVKKLQEQAALFNLLNANGITTMQQLFEKVSDMNSAYYDLRGEIVKEERQIKKLEEHISMYEQYEKHKGICRQLKKVKPEKREQFRERHYAEFALYEAAVRYLDDLKAAGEPITPKKWRSKVDTLTAKKDLQYQDMRAMREELKAVERLKKTAEQLARSEQAHKKEEHEL